MGFKHCVLFFLTANLALTHVEAAGQDNAADTTVMQVTLWGGKSGRSLYEHDLLEQILLKTSSHYPAFNLQMNTQNLGAERGRQTVADGILANIYVSGLRQDKYTRTQNIIPIPTPIMKGLLGYRTVLIRQEDASRFQQAVQQSDLRSWVIGQGHSWADVDILRHNGFTVNDNGRYENLLNMLTYSRFDMVLFGVAEAAAELAASHLQEQLTIVEETIIYYPHAMVYQVSGQHPELARRVAEGLAIVERDGTLARLLEKHFGEALALIQQKKDHIIVLNHPTPTQIPELIQPLLATQR
ncbi:transporter substrate-binding domain-containing protein [Gilvimarinus agarilyticus]|uniref:transporter substrate-binding domain-containing protein n=1 Tax=Gilvimarinus sp. 2_MG-2023 TaxID=3062666 RepID=UPI001C09972A|nr:transporter substrate-binding domain-containing protein [Gilvimarinus sp. 2_MG-2023]MBU2885301.1 transporter substrate-binding domain-containing protein [Gilvimarinus agarilyticus]MDO6570200.1 transporter substrate-binding domain-containing protein [Gilvimarinus sp. 2_MG-2023]